MKENQNKSQVRMVMVPFLFLVAFALGSSILLVLFYDKYFSGFIQGNNNTFCQDYFDKYIKDKSDGEIDKDLLNYQICKHPNQKKHFLWVNMDGFSFDQLKQIKQELSKDIHVYKSVGPTYRQTGAMHESYMTGKPSLNLIGGEVTADNIAIQIAQAEQQAKVKLIGTNFPLFSLIARYVDQAIPQEEKFIFQNLCGKDDLKELFKWEDKIPEYDVESKGVNFDRAQLESILEKKFPTYVEEEKFKSNFTDCLITTNLAAGNLTVNRSVIYYTSYTDSLNHAYSKAHSYNLYAYLRINKILIQMIKYFQNNLKDSVIFLSSDHGGQFFNGEDNFCNHGCVSDTNQGMLLIASNDTIGQGDEHEISYLDLMPTISQYLEGVNLPLFNRGIAHPMKKGDFVSELLVKHQKFIQLKEYFRKVDNIILKEGDDLEEKYNQILKKKDLTKEQKDTIVKEYIDVINKLQKQVVASERSKKDFRLVNLIQLLLIIGFGYIVLFNYKKAIEEWRQLQFMQKIFIILILILYFSDNILVLNVQNIGVDFYENSFNINIACFIIFIIFFQFYDFSKNTIKTMQLSFHKCDNRQSDFEQQSLTAKSTFSYESLPNGSTDSLDMFANGEANGASSESKLKQIYHKIIKLPSQYSKKIEQYLSLQRCLVIILLMNILFQVLIRNDVFVYTKKFFMETVTKWNSFNYFNYSIFILFYFYPKIKTLQIQKYHKYYYIILYAMMIGYDLIDLRYLVKKTKNQVLMCRLISVYFFVGLIYNARRGYLLLKQDKEEQHNTSLSIFQNTTTRNTQSPAYNAKKKFFTFLHIDIAVFVFWISDEIERVYMIFLFFTFALISRKINLILNIVQAQSNKGLFNSFIISLFLTVLIFKNSQAIYSSFKGTLSLDINLQSGNKTIGEYQDQTPIYTAILFGIDKMLVMIFGYMEIVQQLFRISIKENTIKFDNITKGLIAIILIKITISGFQTCYNFFDESSFLSLFLWFAAMSVVVLLSILPYSIIKFILFLIGLTDKKSAKKSSNHFSV